MGTYILRRLLQMIPVVLGATFIIYVLVFELPGDPTAGKCGERPCPAPYVAEFRETYNLDDHVVVAYSKYMGNVAQGDLGETFRGVSVAEELRDKYPVTAKLAVMALAFEAILGILAGVLAGLRKGGFLDNLILVSTLFVISVPVFVIGFIGQQIFGVQLGIVPILASDGSFASLLLPAMVLGSTSLAYVARLMRTSIVENVRSDYIRTAKAKGLKPSRVVGVHTLRNSMIPVVTFLGYDFGALLGGAIVTENIFNIKGIGGFIAESIRNKEGVAVVGSVTVLVLVYLLVNLIVDLLYGALDPRISND